MMEMKITVTMPDLAAAICKLAAAITPPDINTLTPDELRGAPAAAPVPPRGRTRTCCTRNPYPCGSCGGSCCPYCSCPY